MNNLLKYLLVLVLIISASISLADNNDVNSKEEPIRKSSVIRGKVIDKLTQEELVCAKVILNNNEQEVCTDINGNFEFTDLQPGKYEITVKYISYQDKKLKELKIKANKVEELTIDLETL